jgi:predicted nuclease with TOPRIM domain
MSKVSISSPRVLTKPKRPGVHCKKKSSKIKTSNISLVVGLVGALGLKEGWNIWKKKIDNSTQIKSEIRKDNRQRIRELEDQVNELRERIEKLLIENADLKANVARLEERILLTAKNRVKNKDINE